MKKFGLAIALGAIMLLSAPSALAQYPGPTTTTTAPTSQTEVEGTLVPGQTVVFDTCGLQPNSTVTLTLNGVAIGTDTVEGDGCVRQTVTVASATGTAAGASVIAAIGGRSLLAQQGSASLIIDGRTFTARVGQNTLVVAGTQPSGAPRTVTHVFNITGSATGGTGGLARTGGMIAKWSVAGLLLIGAGFAVVTINRRRQQAL